MFQGLKFTALALLLSGFAVVQVFAATIMDPIVRTRSGTGGSIPIATLPFSFDWGEFPGLPPGFDPPDCFTGSEDSMAVVTCEFVNQTGQTINFLDFNFNYDNTQSGPPDPEFLFIQDGTPDDGDAIGWNSLNITQFNAQFIGNGVPPLDCPFEGECVPFHFFVDLVGFPEGTHITMNAAAEPVPEPMTLTLMATGLAFGAAKRCRRNK